MDNENVSLLVAFFFRSISTNWLHGLLCFSLLIAITWLWHHHFSVNKNSNERTLRVLFGAHANWSNVCFHNLCTFRRFFYLFPSLSVSFCKNSFKTYDSYNYVYHHKYMCAQRNDLYSISTTGNIETQQRNGEKMMRWKRRAAAEGIVWLHTKNEASGRVICRSSFMGFITLIDK